MTIERGVDASETVKNAIRGRARAKRQDRLLDEALEETFPASDPVSVARVK